MDMASKDRRIYSSWEDDSISKQNIARPQPADAPSHPWSPQIQTFEKAANQ